MWDVWAVKMFYGANLNRQKAKELKEKDHPPFFFRMTEQTAKRRHPEGPRRPREGPRRPREELDITK